MFDNKRIWQIRIITFGLNSSFRKYITTWRCPFPPKHKSEYDILVYSDLGNILQRYNVLALNKLGNNVLY